MVSHIELFKIQKLNANNFIIDDFDEFLNQIPLMKRLEIEKDTQFLPIALNNYIYLPFTSNIIEEIKKFNYMKVTAENYKTAYYFINNVEYAADGNTMFTLELDVLNTFQGLEFKPSTFVVREHVDRWDYNGLYINKETDTLFLLRNFSLEKDDEQPKRLKYSGFFYPDNTSKLIKNNYWVRIKLKDSINGLRICFLNLFNSFNVLIGEEIKTITAFTLLGIEKINLLIQNTTEIIEIELDPYPPHERLKNVGIDTIETIDIKEMPTFTVIPFEITPEGGQPVVFYFIGVTFYTALLDLKSLSIPLLKISNISGIYDTLTGLLYKMLVVKKTNATAVIYQLNNYMLYNGFFVLPDQPLPTPKESRDFSDFYAVNESNTLGMNYLSLKVDFNGFNHTILIENIKLKNKDTFKDFCNNMEAGEKSKNFIISLFYKGYLFSNGGALYFEPGEYFNYIAYNGNAVPVDYFSNLPSITNEALKYEKEAQLRTLEAEKEKTEPLEEIDDNRKWWRKGFDWANAEAEKFKNAVKKAGPKVWTGFKKGVMTFARTGSIVKSAVSAGVGALFAEESRNNKNAAKSSNFEQAIIKNEFKASFELDQIDKVETLEKTYYYTGNLVNCYKIPLHNNRLFFDFLQCQPVFNGDIDANTEIIEKIKDFFADGVYYIHKVKLKAKNKEELDAFFWIFPDEDAENIERKLLENLSND